MLRDHKYITEIVDRVSITARQVLGHTEQENKNNAGTQRRPSITGDMHDLNKLIAHLQRYFHDRNAVAKLDALGEGSITLRAFFCVVLHSLSEGEIETCLRWCQAFRAHDVLKE